LLASVLHFYSGRPLQNLSGVDSDLIICKRTRPVRVLHERKSRVTLAARLVGKAAAETISVMLAVALLAKVS